MVVFIIVLIIAVIGGIIYWAVSTDNEESEQKNLSVKQNLYDNFGRYTSEITYDSYYNDGGLMLVNIEQDKILIDSKIFKISNIESVEPRVERSQKQITYKEKQVVKTNTGEAVGRAIAGGLIAGGVGAVIGGATASKEIKTVRTPQTSYTQDSFKLYVNIKEPKFRSCIKTKNEEDVYRVRDFIEAAISQIKR